MSNHIDASFRTVNDINYDSLRLVGGRAEVRTITVGDEDYKITFANNGKVSVSFANTSFFHLFMGSAKTAVKEKIQELVDLNQERVDLNSFVKDVSNVVVKTSLTDNLVRTLTKKTGTLVSAPEGKFAHYGFSGVRERSTRGINLVSGRIGNGKAGVAGNQLNGSPKVHSQLISVYNLLLDLHEDNLNAAKTIAFVRDNNNGTLNLENLEGDDEWDPDAGYSKEEIRDWCEHLKGKDLDLFSKIRGAKAEANAGKTTGWAGEILRQGLDGAVRDMVRKNLDPRIQDKFPDCDFLISGVAKAIIEVSEMEIGNLSEEAICERIKEIVAKYAPTGKADAALRVFNDVATCAFWRQTSKQGLEFFRNRGEPIVFDWTRFNGEKMDDVELENKWWKNGDEDVGDHYGVAITNSEMRHIIKWEKNGFNADGNSVIKVGGGLSQSAVEERISRNVDELGHLPADEIARITADLTVSFRSMKASDFYGAAEHILMALPDVGWLDRNSKLASDQGIFWTRAIEDTLGRVKARINAVKSPVVKAAMLMNSAALFEAEFLKDPTLLDRLSSREDMPEDNEQAQQVPANVICTRRLAGLDRGRGMDVFFSPDTGRPNALGELVLHAADGDVQNLVGIVSRLKENFASKFGCQAGEAFAHPAFRSYLVRAAASVVGKNVDGLIGMLDLVKGAYDAKLAVKNHLAGLGELSKEVQELYDRRGDWDIDRLVFKEVQSAMQDQRDVDLQKLKKEVEDIRDICAKTIAFVGEISDELGKADIQLDEDERRRLADSYLDRDLSAVRNYRVDGTGSERSNYDDEYPEVLAKTKAQIQTLLDLSKGTLPSQVFKSLVIIGVAHAAKDRTLKIAFTALNAAMKGGPFTDVKGKTKAEKAENAIRTLADRVREDILREFAEGDDPMGYDELTTITRLYLNAYFAADPSLKRIFDEIATDSDAMDQIQQTYIDLRTDPNSDNVTTNLFEEVSQYGML